MPNSLDLDASVVISSSVQKKCEELNFKYINKIVWNA